MLYTQGDIDRMSHTLEMLMEDSYALYHEIGTTGRYSPTPEFTGRKCSVQIIPRLVPGGNLSGGSQTSQTRFMLRVMRDDPVRARDKVVVTNFKSGETTRHTVQSVRGPHSLYSWRLADLSDPE